MSDIPNTVRGIEKQGHRKTAEGNWRCEAIIPPHIPSWRTARYLNLDQQKEVNETPLTRGEITHQCDNTGVRFHGGHWVCHVHNDYHLRFMSGNHFTTFAATMAVALGGWS